MMPLVCRRPGPQPTKLQLAAIALIAWLSVHQGRPEDVADLLERCVVACGARAADGEHWRDRPETDIGLPAVVEFAWGAELMARRDPRAIAVFARAREKFHSIGNRGGEVSCEFSEAVAAAFLGSAEQATSICQRHLERTTAAGAGWERSWAQTALAIALTKHGDAGEALELGRAALAYLLPLRDQWGITDRGSAANTPGSTLAKLATEIAYLAGGLKTQRARLGVLIVNLGPVANEMSIAEKVAREVLGQQTYTDIEKRGSRLFLERSKLERLALGTLSINKSSGEHPTGKGTSPSWRTLSEAEQEVAIFAAAGWPNSAIGVRRGTSTRTTDAQISKILQKLMIDSREDIVRFIPPDQRDRVSAERSHIPRRS